MDCHQPSQGTIDVYFQSSVLCPPGEEWNEATHTCEPPSECEAGKPTKAVTTLGRAGMLACSLDPDTGKYCEMLYSDDSQYAGLSQGIMVGGDQCDPNNYQCIDGWMKRADGFCYQPPQCPDGVSYDPEIGMCKPNRECPEGQVQDATGRCVPMPECPAGKIRAPDGSCIDDPDNCPPGFVKGADGTCKPDSDGDGEPDGGTENTASGGEMCDSPPVCSGDEIMCLQAKKLWQIDCNTRRGQASWVLDHYCQQPPVCNAVAGSWQPDRTQACSPEEEAAMVLRWRQVCELTKVVDELRKLNGVRPGQPGGCTDGDCNENGQPDWTENPGSGELPPAEDDGQGNGAIGEEREIVVAGGVGGALNDIGLGYSRTCPDIPTVEVFGTSIDFNNGPLCQWLALGGQLVLIFAALASLKILSMGGSV